MTRTTSRLAVHAGLALLMFAGGFASAAAVPPEPQSELAQQQQLSDYIKEGLPHDAAAPVIDTDMASAAECASGAVGSGHCTDRSGSASRSAGSHASDTVGHGPAQSAFVAAFAHSLAHPDAAPPGANDWTCKPSARHPEPVVLVHGTWANAYSTYASMSQPLTDAGFCVFTFNYGRSNPAHGGGALSPLPGVGGTGDIRESADQLAQFVDRVLAATGAKKTNLIGHSQGGAMSRWYLKFDGGKSKVHHLITVGATNHGTTLDGLGALGRAINNLGIDLLGVVELPVGRAGVQQVVGSDFVKQLNKGGDTVPGVDYTVIGTRFDEVSTPYDATFLTAGPGATVDNITLQDGCDKDMSDHLTATYSPRTLSIVLNALDPKQTPTLVCAFNPWLLGGADQQDVTSSFETEQQQIATPAASSR